MMNRSPRSFRRAMFRLAFGLIGATLSLAPAAAAEALNYADVLSALQSGKTTTVLSDLGHCANPETGKAGPAMRVGLRIQAFSVIPEKGLSFADVHQTLDPSDQPVTEYIRYNLKPDGQMTLNVTRQTTAGMAKQQPLLICQLAVGVRFVWWEWSEHGSSERLRSSPLRWFRSISASDLWAVKFDGGETHL